MSSLVVVNYHLIHVRRKKHRFSHPERDAYRPINRLWE